MKKLICLTIAMFAMLACMNVALAVDAVYNNGIITVSTSDSGFFEIIIDGTLTDRWVGTGMQSNSFSMQLENGKHTVRLYSPDGDGGSSNTFWVGPVQENAQENGESSESGTSNEPVKVSAAEPTCVKEGVDENGNTIPALGHRYKIVNHTDSMNYFECVRCGNKMQANANMAIQNRYGNIILNGEGAVADYKAAPSKENKSVMTFTLDQAAEKIVVTLDNSLIMQIMREGSSQVEIVNGKTVTTIDLYQISPSWFNTAEKVETYIFTVDSEAQITVQTMVNGELLTADTFAGVTVK